MGSWGNRTKTRVPEVLRAPSRKPFVPQESQTSPVNKMDTTGTFRKESREFKVGVWDGLAGLEKIVVLDGGR